MTGNLSGAARAILSANILGASCARVCPTEVLCEGACVLLDRDRDPIKIGRPQRYASDHVSEHKLTLVLFDDEYLVPFRSLPVAEILPLDRKTYVPRSSTALLDAIGQTIDDLGMRLAAMAENARPAQVIVAILTDGLENVLHEVHLATGPAADQTPDRRVSMDLPLPRGEPGCDRDRWTT